MSNINDYLFGPLDKKYCAYFYYLSVIGYVLMLLVLISLIAMLVMDKKTDMKLVMGSVYLVLLYFILYFQSRLLNTVCLTSLR